MREDRMRYLVLRVPNSGPKALAGAPNDFPKREEASVRCDENMATQLKLHHTHLEIVAYSGDKITYLESQGILY